MVCKSLDQESTSWSTPSQLGKINLGETCRHPQHSWLKDGSPSGVACCEWLGYIRDQGLGFCCFNNSSTTGPEEAKPSTAYEIRTWNLSPLSLLLIQRKYLKTKLANWELFLNVKTLFLPWSALPQPCGIRPDVASIRTSHQRDLHAGSS